MSVQLAGNASAYGKEKFISYTYPNGSERQIAFVSEIISSSENNYAQLKMGCIFCFLVLKLSINTCMDDISLCIQIIKHHDNSGPMSGVPILAAARLQ